MTENMIHFRREEDAGAPMLSVAAHPDEPARALIFQSWGQPVVLNATEARQLLIWLDTYRGAICLLAEQHEQAQRYALLQEIEQLAQSLHFEIQIEDGLIDVISNQVSQAGQAASFRSDLDGFAAAFKWLKARQSESEANNGNM